MKDDHFIASEPKMFESFNDRLRLIVQIGNQHDDGPPRQEVRRLMQPLCDLSPSTGLNSFDDSEDRSEVTRARAGRDLFDHLLIKGEQPYRIVLPHSEVCERR